MTLSTKRMAGILAGKAALSQLAKWRDRSSRTPGSSDRFPARPARPSVPDQPANPVMSGDAVAALASAC
jgi:hypothetical protein